MATAAEDRLSFRRNPHTSFAAASDALGFPIDRMAWIDGHAVCADRVVVAALLLEFLAAFVTVRAQAVQFL